MSTTTQFLVWGCGDWPERHQLIDPEVDEPMDAVHEDHPAFDLLPAEFVREWGEVLGSEHWAEIVQCSEAELDAATRHSPNVAGYRFVK